MEDDNNTSKVIYVQINITKEAKLYLEYKQTSTKVIQSFQESILLFLDVLGIGMDEDGELLAEEVEALIQERTEARKDKNFARADEIREELTQKNILLEDTVQGIRWRRG